MGRVSEAKGVVYTRASDAALMCRWALAEYGEIESADRLPRVLDPACGSGVFLSEMLRSMVELGWTGPETAAKHLFGIDISEDAVETARANLSLAAGLGNQDDGLKSNIVCQDSLLAPIDNADIVIGNPPYIRSSRLKPGYIDKVLQVLSSYFDPKDLSHLPRSSDLYVYFILRGISLLNFGGVLCYLVPNSWLTAKYGAGLRKILNSYTTVPAVYDFPDSRRFSDASVNSCVLLVKNEKPDDKAVTRFLVFDDSKGEPRVVKELKQDEASSENFNVNVFIRSPDIYELVMNRCRDRLVPFGKLAKIKRGITTGVNEFFYPSQEMIRQFEIEGEYLYPVVRTPKDCTRIVITDTANRIFICDLPKESLRGAGSLRYIEWGESQGYQERPSCRTRSGWWRISAPPPSSIAWIKAVDRVHRSCRLEGEMLVDQRLYGITSRQPVELNLILNSALMYFLREVHGRTSLGEGVLDSAVVDARDLPVPVLDVFPHDYALKTERILASRDILPIEKELFMPDRQEFDLFIFSSCGFTAGEVEAIYEETIRLVERRTARARTAPR